MFSVVKSSDTDRMADGQTIPAGTEDKVYSGTMGECEHILEYHYHEYSHRNDCTALLTSTDRGDDLAVVVMPDGSVDKYRVVRS